MTEEIAAPGPEETTRGQRARAYAVHIYTASGVAFAFLAAAELTRNPCDARLVIAWLTAAVLIDATDGPLARLWQVKTHAPRIAGRTIDDIVDYLTFTFIPLLLVWRMEWLPPFGSIFLVLAMMASLFGFANVKAKFEEKGFFLGFPSYWNIYAFYAGLLAVRVGPWWPLALLITLTILTVAPVRFIYPNRVQAPWRLIVLVGAALWFALVLVMLRSYPSVSGELFWLSLIYPLFYLVLSVGLDRKDRRERRMADRE